jgi:hypothetical protein
MGSAGSASALAGTVIGIAATAVTAAAWAMNSRREESAPGNMGRSIVMMVARWFGFLQPWPVSDRQPGGRNQPVRLVRRFWALRPWTARRPPAKKPDSTGVHARAIAAIGDYVSDGGTGSTGLGFYTRDDSTIDLVKDPLLIWAPRISI